MGCRSHNAHGTGWHSDNSAVMQNLAGGGWLQHMQKVGWLPYRVTVLAASQPHASWAGGERIYSNAHWFSRRTSSSSSGVKSFCIQHPTRISTTHQAWKALLSNLLLSGTHPFYMPHRQAQTLDTKSKPIFYATQSVILIRGEPNHTQIHTRTSLQSAPKHDLRA